MKKEEHYGLINRNPYKWVQYKGWFFLDLPKFINQNGFTNGVELGAKEGRSMFFMLQKSSELNLVGIDLWESIEDSAYNTNNKNFEKCRKKLKRFGNRIELRKGDTAVLASNYENNYFEFVHYDLQTASLNTVESHTRILSQWIKKVMNGGVVVGRDFRNPEIRLALNKLGFKDSDIKPCQINTKLSLRMEYVKVKHT